MATQSMSRAPKSLAFGYSRSAVRRETAVSAGYEKQRSYEKLAMNYRTAESDIADKSCLA